MARNISRISENALIGMTSHIEGTSKKDAPASSVSSSSQKGFLVRLPGFEPGLENWQSSVIAKLDHSRAKARLDSHLPLDK